MVRFLLLMSVVFLCLDATPVSAGSKKKGGGGGSPDNQKTLDFEGEVVEGVNKMPLDSLSTTSEDGDRSKRRHLYQRVKDFDEETQELSQEIAETY